MMIMTRWMMIIFMIKIIKEDEDDLGAYTYHQTDKNYLAGQRLTL